MVRSLLCALSFAVITMSACGGDAMMSANEAPEVITIQPAPASVRISTSTQIRLTFSRPMMIGTELLVRLHEDTVTGTDVRGTQVWSSDRTVLTFNPTTVLKPDAMYVVHLGGEMRGMDGALLNHARCEERGGRSVSTGMMGQRNMMGTGWRTAVGTYGMIFPFRTA